MTPTQLCDHFVGLINSLNIHSVRLALETNMTINKVEYGKVEPPLVAITQVLTSLLITDECLALENGGRSMLLVRDPQKTNIDQPPDKPCKFCGRFHWQKSCFKNPNADLETQKKAAQIAPKSPAALTYRKNQGGGEESAKPAIKSPKSGPASAPRNRRARRAPGR